MYNTVIQLCTHESESQSVMSDSCGPMDCSLLGSSVHGILQIRVWSGLPTPSSSRSSWPRDQTCIFMSYTGRQVPYHYRHLGSPQLHMCVYTCVCVYIYIFFSSQILFPYRLLHNIEHSSWFYIADLVGYPFCIEYCRKWLFNYHILCF